MPRRSNKTVTFTAPTVAELAAGRIQQADEAAAAANNEVYDPAADAQGDADLGITPTPGSPGASTAAQAGAASTDPGLDYPVVGSATGAGGVPTGGGAPAPTPTAAPAPVVNPVTGQTQAQTIQSAEGIINAVLASVPGLAQLDPTGIFSTWINGQVAVLAGQGLDAGSIASQIQLVMNNPGATGDTAAQAVFDAVFPGYNAKIAAGTTNSDGSYTGIAGYVQYSAQVKQFAEQAGLVNGTISQGDIGNLWAGNVSSSEVSQRVTDATVATNSAPQEVKDYLAANYGMTPGALTSYYLNPTNTLQTIQQNINAGMVGGEAAATGFDKDLSTARAQTLGAFLANGTSAGNGAQVGGVNSVGAAQAANAFTSGLGSNGAGGALGSAAAMANAGYTSANLPGQVGGTISEDTLLSAIEGNAQALNATAQAEQTRTAGSRGGGGVATTSKGAIGIGYASEG